MSRPTHKEITDYFRSNIFDSISYYTAWKMIAYSKSKNVVSEPAAKRYVDIQNYHTSFFVTTQNAHLIAFVLSILHSFDRRDDSYSLYKVNKKLVQEFERNNKVVIDALRDVRNKIFAHRDVRGNPTKYKIPPINDLDIFFSNLVELYNKLTKIVDDSGTIFDNAEAIKHDIENLFMNLYRGESMRKKEINIEWSWRRDGKKASDIL